MNAYHPAQEFNDLRWGTSMPIPLMIASRLVQVRARGSCSLIVKDVKRLEEKVPDPDNLTTLVRSFLASTMTDVIGEISFALADIAQLTTVTEQTTSALQAKLDPKLDAIGLQIKVLSIEAIETV